MRGPADYRRSQSLARPVHWRAREHSKACQAPTPARRYGHLIGSERRSRAHPVLLQKVHEGAHLRQKQAGAQGQDAQWRGRPLIGLEHNPEPSVGETMRNLPGWHPDEPGPCQGRNYQRIEVIGAKPGWDAQRSSPCAVLEAPFRHAWYIAEGHAVLPDQVVRRRRLAAPAQIIRRGADHKLDVVELADNEA
jgi:hypothetical protein